MKELTTRDESGLRFLMQLVVDGVDAANSKATYTRCLDAFFEWWLDAKRPVLCKATVNAYRAHLLERGYSARTINLHLVCVRKLVYEAVDAGIADTSVALSVQKVKGVRASGQKIGRWLDQDSAQKLLNAPGMTTIKGIRDTAILAVALGAGLRRSELAAITVDMVREIEGRAVITNILGKNGRVRSVPIADWTKRAIDRWLDSSGIEEGPVFRAIRHGGKSLGPPLNPGGFWAVVAYYSEQALGRRIAPHDCRRTFARLAWKNGAPIAQLQLCLGHADQTQTEQYVNAQLDLQNAAADYTGLHLD